MKRLCELKRIPSGQTDLALASTLLRVVEDVDLHISEAYVQAHSLAAVVLELARGTLVGRDVATFGKAGAVPVCSGAMGVGKGILGENSATRAWSIEYVRGKARNRLEVELEQTVPVRNRSCNRISRLDSAFLVNGLGEKRQEAPPYPA